MYIAHFDIIVDCIDLEMSNVTFPNGSWELKFDTRHFLKEHNFTLQFDRFVLFCII